MTRLAILSDIHANLPALEAVIADMQPFSVDHVIVAGDIINWGPFSVEVVERITSLGWGLIRGNHEYYLLDYDTPRAPDLWKTFDTPRWLNNQLDGHWKNVIAAWPESLSLRYPDAPLVQVFHATPRDIRKGIHTIESDDEIIPRLDGVDESFIICGHTHLRMNRQIGRWRVFNPGAVGAPLDGKLGASYLILDGDADGWHPTFRRAMYDPAPNFVAFAERKIVEELGSTGRLLIHEYKTARPQIYPFNEWCRLHHPDAPRTVALAERFIAEVDDIDPYLPAAYQTENIANIL
ncbi:MAG: metallophosphoesterase family protein [Chloroflexota bacterium]